MNVVTTGESARARLEPLLTVEDLERLLRVDRRTVARLCKQGRLPQPLKVGGGNRWRVDDIVDVIEGSIVRREREAEPENELAAAV